MSVYNIIKEEGIKIEKIGEPQKDPFTGNWFIHVTYWFLCPSCEKKDNSLQSGDWRIQGENFLPSRNSSKTCFNCKHEYKPILIANCDFSDLKKDVKNEQISNKEKYVEESIEQGDSKPGLFKRIIIKFFRFAFYLFANRKGNLLGSILGLNAILMHYFGIQKFQDAEDARNNILIFASLFILYIARSIFIYRKQNVELKVFLKEDLIESFKNIVRIFNDQKIPD